MHTRAAVLKQCFGCSAFWVRSFTMSDFEAMKTLFQTLEANLGAKSDTIVERIDAVDESIKAVKKDLDDYKEAQKQEIEKLWAALTAAKAGSNTPSTRAPTPGESSGSPPPAKMARRSASQEPRRIMFNSQSWEDAEDDHGASGNSSDPGRGLAGTRDDGHEKFRTIKVYGLMKEDTPQADRVAFLKKLKDQLQVNLDMQFEVCAFKAWKPKGRDMGLTLPSRALAWQIVDKARALEEPIQVDGKTCFLNMQKVGHELDKDKVMGKVMASLHALMGEVKGTESAFKAHYPSGKIFHQAAGIPIGLVEIENGAPIFKTHAVNCEAAKVDPTQWKDKARLLIENSSGNAGFS